jgi:hypothetical protein
MQWISVKEQQPPNIEVRVKDEHGNESNAIPCYYPFEIVKLPGDERKPFGWRGTPLFFDNNEEKWDGSWMIDVTDDWTKEIGKITHWRLLNNHLNAQVCDATGVQ